MNGLLKPSFIPYRRQRELRELCRYRKSLIVDLGAEKSRLQKILEGANIKLSGTISDINGKSGKALLNYIVSGEIFDEEAYERLLAEKLISKRLKAPFLSSFTEKHYKQGGTDFKSDQHFFGPFLKYEKQFRQR